MGVFWDEGGMMTVFLLNTCRGRVKKEELGKERDTKDDNML